MALSETNPVYGPFFGVMGAASAIIFSGELIFFSHKLSVCPLTPQYRLIRWLHDLHETYSLCSLFPARIARRDDCSDFNFIDFAIYFASPEAAFAHGRIANNAIWFDFIHSIVNTALCTVSHFRLDFPAKCVQQIHEHDPFKSHALTDPPDTLLRTCIFYIIFIIIIIIGARYPYQ